MARLSRTIINRSCKLRNEPTKAERVLWKMLRDRQIFGWRFRRQHPTEPFSQILPA